MNKWKPVAVPLLNISSSSWTAEFSAYSCIAFWLFFIDSRSWSILSGILVSQFLDMWITDLKLDIKSTPGIIGTVIPTLLQSFTKSMKTFASKTIWVMIKSAPASTWNKLYRFGRYSLNERLSLYSKFSILSPSNKKDPILWTAISDAYPDIQLHKWRISIHIFPVWIWPDQPHEKNRLNLVPFQVSHSL